MAVGVCVYSGQASLPLLHDAIRAGKVQIIRQMYEWDKANVASPALAQLLELVSSDIVENLHNVEVHVCLWNANQTIPPPSGGLNWLSAQTIEPTSVGQWNETDLRYGWSEWPNNGMGDVFRGADGRPVTNFPYAWKYNLFNPFNGSARWYLGASELAMRMAMDPHAQNSGGLTRERGWIATCAPHTEIIDLHVYAPTAVDVAVVVAKQMLVWDRFGEKPFFLGECGPHSTHGVTPTPEEAAAWIVECDQVLSARWGSRYHGACYHGPNHIQMLEHLPS